MAKYVLKLDPSNIPQPQPISNWQLKALAFGEEIRDELAAQFGLQAQLFPDEDGMELDEGCMGMGKDWFNFRFRVFAGVAVYIEMLNVPMEWRSKHIGYYIVARLKEFCRSNGLYYIFLGSYEGANPFWEKCGFKMVTEYPDFVVGHDFLSK